jgi:hypothetical protein
MDMHTFGQAENTSLAVLALHKISSILLLEFRFRGMLVETPV